MSMLISEEFRLIIKKLSDKFPIPKISRIFFPQYSEFKPSKKGKFMAMGLESGAVGLSYTLMPEQRRDEYRNLKETDFLGQNPVDIALIFGKNNDPIKNMLGLAAINSICQHILKTTKYKLDFTTNPLGLLTISQEDKVGMVGLFNPLLNIIEETGAELVVIEKKEELIKQYPNVNITLDPSGLKSCNKVLCTASTILNNTLDEIIKNCSSGSKISIIGPTAGFLPDPLFNRGVDVVGGTFIVNDEQFFKKLKQNNRWGLSTKKYCFQKETYQGFQSIL